jgi:hypothetical protein
MEFSAGVSRFRWDAEHDFSSFPLPSRYRHVMINDETVSCSL